VGKKVRQQMRSGYCEGVDERSGCKPCYGFIKKMVKEGHRPTPEGA